MDNEIDYSSPQQLTFEERISYDVYYKQWRANGKLYPSFLDAMVGSTAECPNGIAIEPIPEILNLLNETLEKS